MKHLLHIGYPKAGSTFLQRWFDTHPQLAHRYGALAGLRDMHELAREGTTRRSVLYRVTSNEEFSAPRPDAGQERVDYKRPRELGVAESQDHVCALLAGLFPNATVLIVTRGFRSMILSSFSQYVRTGGDVDLVQKLRPAEKGDEPQTTDLWNYDRLIGVYQRAFGMEKVMVMPYELLRDDMGAFIGTLAGRLGIEAIPASPRRVNESLSSTELYWYPRLTRAMQRIPSRRLYEAYLHAALRNYLRRPIALLQRLRPGTPFTADSIPHEAVAAFRGHAESLRGNPLYAPYAAEYLHP
jgi:hypothetical protein